MPNKNDKPWETKPDYLKGTFSGINYYIKRNPEMKFLCGYITIPKNNPFYILDQDHPKLYEIPTHGGITYREVEENGDYTIGFDCGHYNDQTPGFKEMLGVNYSEELHANDIYRDIDYVEDICKQACWIIV